MVAVRGSDMMIRRATYSDAEILSRLNLDVQRLHARALPHLFKTPHSADFALQFMQDQLADPNNIFYIAQQDGEDIGYVFARLIERTENAFMYGWKYLYIDQISVKASHRGIGCGRQLMETVFQLAKQEGIRRIALETWSFNQDAQAFFTKLGFEAINFHMWQEENPA